MEDANTFVYFDDDVSVCANTIISVDSASNNVVLKSEYDGHRVIRLGDGALAKSQNIKTLTIEEGIEELGEESVYECSELETVFLPSSLTTISDIAFIGLPNIKQFVFARRMTKNEFEQIKRRSVKCGSDEFLIRNPNAYPELFGDFLKSIDSIVKPAVFIDEAMGTLFIDDGIEDSSYKKYFSFDGRRGFVDEITEFVNLINTDYSVCDSKIAEAFNDSAIKRGCVLAMHPSLIGSFDTKEVEEDGMNVIVKFRFVINVYYFQSPKKIMLAGKEYYVYRRQYINGEDHWIFSRKIRGVYTKEGRVTDSKLEREVIAKHELLGNL